MKIVFICSSAGAGRDGVGDYCRRLAAELAATGHQPMVLALSDKFTDNEITEEQYTGDMLWQVCRIPAGLAIAGRLKKAQNLVDAFNPHWLSLQYVPFAYHPKGLRLGLSKWLQQIGGNRRWHIMFHELWVGMAAEEPAKLIWWGRAQQVLIRSLLQKIKPLVIHTQTRLYQAQLKKLGFDAGYLPLFGNIPVTASEVEQSLANSINLVLFGAIHSGGLIAPFARQAAAYAREHGVNVKLTFVGRCGDEQYRWAGVWKAEGLLVAILGEQSPAEISQLLTTATAGISTTGLAVVEKSGAFAAMRNHGLPVISLSKPWTPFRVPELAIPPGIVKYNGNNFEACLQQSQRYAPNAGKALAVARQLLDDLQAATQTPSG